MNVIASPTDLGEDADRDSGSRPEVPLAQRHLRRGPRQRGGTPGRRRIARLFEGLVFAGPGLVLFVVLVLTPIVMTIAQSFTDLSPFKSTTAFIGLKNYVDMFASTQFHQVLWNTVVITVVVTLLPNAVGLGIALLLDRRGRLYTALRSVFFVPVVLSGVVISVIWQSILRIDGPVDQLFTGLGLTAPGWLADPSIAIYTVSGIISWQVLGFCVVVYLAGLQAIPGELQEAATVDGANWGQRFRNVTWPMLAPAVTINTIMLLITGFKVYDQVQVLTNGGPGVNGTATIAFDVIRIGFLGNHIGYASAVATVMLLFVAIVSVFVLRLLQKREVTL